MSFTKGLRITMLMAVVVSVAGCFSQMLEPRKTVNSSLVDFLYPNAEKQVAIPSNEQPIRLNVPLRIGLAFVPTATGSGLADSEQVALLEKVKKSFASESYVKDIAIIPNTYLRGKKGFPALAQVGALYNVDVMALMSYDQVVNATDNKASLLYWTLVGAYFVKGSENAVNTFVDLAIFDLPSQRMLLRAAGTSVVENSSTLVNAEAQFRKDRLSGFQLAVDDLNKQLGAEIAKFREKMASSRPPAVKR